MEEENYMFRLSAFRKSLLAHYTGNKNAIYPGTYFAHVVDSLSSAPLEDLSISRRRSRLSWGVPVPNDPEHTIYVWFDALTVYLSGIGYPWTANDIDLAKFWPPNLQVIGKDILR
jgi:methionyl-tRNA synthetase